MNFKCFVVRYDNRDPKNFIPLTSLDSSLYKLDTWTRNKIKEVHVISSVAFVADTPEKLRSLMLPLQNFVTETPEKILKRVSAAKLEKKFFSMARKHGETKKNSFESEVLKYAK